MKIIVIDNYDSFTYNLVHYIEGLGNEVVVMLNDEIDHDEIKIADAIVLSPGPGKPSFSGALMEVIANYYQSKPILGICLGMQALAEYDGMQLFNLNEVWHGRTSLINIDSKSILFKGLGAEITVGRYHSWAVRAVKSPWKMIADVNNEIPMAMSHTTLKHAAVQFHPESVMTPQGKTILKNWLDSLNTI